MGTMMLPAGERILMNCQMNRLTDGWNCCTTVIRTE